MPLRVCTGFELGGTAGWATGNAGNKFIDTATGAVSIIAGGRSGAYEGRLNPSAGSAILDWTTATLATSQTRCLFLFAFKFVGSLPAADSRIAPIGAANGLNGRLWFRSSDSKLVASAEGAIGHAGAQAGPVIAADTWYVVEMHYDVSAATFTLDWTVDDVAQTQSTVSSTASTIATCGWGSSSAQTFDLRVDDVAVYTNTADISFVGRHKVIYLGPDTGGSLDVSTITTSEWNTFAGATPTLSAWNAATALAAIDERPVGLGASADGFCRITGTDADYVGIPFTSYTIAAGETIAGLRMLACCWAASATTCFHSFDAYNGTSAETVFASADVGTDNSGTAPAWVCRMLPTLANYDSQGELDGLQIRFGSTDTTPDAGIHAVYVEVLVKEASAAASLLLQRTLRRHRPTTRRDHVFRTGILRPFEPVHRDHGAGGHLRDPRRGREAAGAARV